MERRLEDADHLAIDIVDRGGGKEQPADQPAIAADPLGRRGDVPLGGIRHPLSPRFSWPVASIAHPAAAGTARSEEHTSELQSLMRISYAVFCLKKKKKPHTT